MRAEAPASLTTQLESLAGEWLKPAIDRFSGREEQVRPKVVNDSLWGSIRLHPWEAAIVDTYLMQRLRFLRQLGVIHWVYPTAAHSRFEHSLGVLHQAEALLGSIARNGRAGEPLVDDHSWKVLRLAALLHDCGHVAMSHVPEPIIKNLPGVEALRFSVQAQFSASKVPSASESFAAVFIMSPSFRHFLGLSSVGAAFTPNVEKTTEEIACAIVGGTTGKNPFLSHIVNGAFDADKLDYMPRDCLMTGIPCPVDVGRILEQVRVLDVPKNKLPDSYPSGDPTSSSKRVLTISGTGARSLAEIAMARSLLFQKVYYHHKVRALELMVLRSIRQMPKLSVTDWLRLDDEELISGTHQRLFRRIKSRDLLKRALVIEALEKDGDAWRELTGETTREAIRTSTQDEALKICRLLGVSQNPLVEQPVEFDLPDLKRMQLDQHAFVGDGLDNFSAADPSTMGLRSEAGRSIAAQDSVAVFAPEEVLLPVFLAARKVLKEKLNYDVPGKAYYNSKIYPGAIAEAEERLIAAGWSCGGPRFVPSVPIETYRARSLEAFLISSRSRVEQLSTKFGPYQAPKGEDRISASRIFRFLRQFEKESLARVALELLEKVDFKDRDFMARSLQSFIGAYPSAKFIAPLGSAGDSSAFLSYLMNDLPDRDRRTVLPIELALERLQKSDGSSESSPSVLLWDDCCGRGSHTLTVFGQWLGHAEVELDENLVDELSPDRQSKLRTTNLKIGFAVARKSGLKRIDDFCKQHGLYASTAPSTAVLEESCRLEANRVINLPRDESALRDFLRTRMRIELSGRWPEEKLADRLLGYGNEAHLLVLPYNVPTITLTALWATGDHWMPLFPRRTKPSATQRSDVAGLL